MASAPAADAASAFDGAVPVDAGPCTGEQIFEYSGVIESFAVPSCARVLTIEAFGAQGGGGETMPAIGGKGAGMTGEFDVFGDEVLGVLVGGRGIDAIPNTTTQMYNPQGGGTGGGGSFVVYSDQQPLIIAAGGGGAVGLLPGGPGQILPLGQAGASDTNTGAPGGVAGAGGTTQPGLTGFHSGTGGAGMLGDGVGASVGDTSVYGTANQPPKSFLNGGAGGIAGSEGRTGGVGGGGSAGFTGGGGGGYTGGGSGFLLVSERGGGGGG